MKPFLFFSLLFLLLLGCDKSEPRHPFISCKLDGVLWESEYRNDGLLSGETPYSTLELIPSGYIWTFYGSDITPSYSSFQISFRVAGHGGPVDSLLHIGYLPVNSGIGFTGDNSSCVGELIFENGGSNFHGKFSGKIFLPAAAPNGPDTIVVTDGRFEN
jgi:hypothetical protein